MEIRQKITLDPMAIDLVNLDLARTSRDPDSGELIETFTADLGDGYEVDIKIVNGDEQAGPYVDAVLFHMGCELCCLEPGFDRVDGEYIFQTDDKKFIVEVVADTNVI